MVEFSEESPVFSCDNGPYFALLTLRSGTSLGANYRAACRGKSPADMIAKLAIVEEEADETIYWIELLIESEILPAHRLSELIHELNQIVAITVSSQKTLPRNNPKSKIENPK